MRTVIIVTQRSGRFLRHPVYFVIVSQNKCDYDDISSGAINIDRLVV